VLARHCRATNLKKSNFHALWYFAKRISADIAQIPSFFLKMNWAGVLRFYKVYNLGIKI